jgi:hypothetical protein
VREKKRERQKRENNKERRSEHALFSAMFYYNYCNKQFDMDGFKL